ncbi:unnamed protein product, partial [marine sediment metagenome]
EHYLCRPTAKKLIGPIISQKNSIIRSVVQEWKMNVNIIRSRKYEETNDKKLNEYTVFPRMQTTVLAGALSSGHFTDKSDPNFSTQASTLNEHLLSMKFWSISIIC